MTTWRTSGSSSSTGRRATQDLTSALFWAGGVEPRSITELDNIDAAKRMVLEGLGVALLPQSAVAAEVESKTLCAVVIEDAIPVRRQIVAIRRREAEPPVRLAADFMAMLESVEPMDVGASTTLSELATSA